MKNQISVKTIEEACKTLKGVSRVTPLAFSQRLSTLYNARIYIKREDLQEVRSYKIRGAYTLMSSLMPDEKKNGVVAASAGNHAQGVAYSAALLKVKATIFMPTITPLQKIDKVKHFGGKLVTVKLTGLTFDEASIAAKEFCKQQNATFVHPFDDYRTITGQGTVGKEIYDELGQDIDYVLCPIGGGGLVAGVGTYIKEKIKKVHLIGVEPQGAAGMHASLKKKQVVTLHDIDTFVDGAAVKTVGEKTFGIAAKLVDEIILVPEGKVCTTMIELYQNEGIITEPAGALSLSALDAIAKEIKGKTVVCVLSGGNNDIMRYPEIMEKSLVYQGLKHYFLLEFAQKPGQLKQFLNHVLGPTDDIVRFEYLKKSSKERGPALVGLELTKKEDLAPLLKKMDTYEIRYTQLTADNLLYGYII